MADIDKPGIKTTELYVASALMIIGTLLTSGVIADGSQLARWLGAAQTVIGGLAYIWSRTSLKTTNASSLVSSDPAVIKALAAAGATSSSTVDSQGAATRTEIQMKKPDGGFVDVRVLLMMMSLTLVAVIAVIGCSAFRREAHAVASGIVDCTAKQTHAAVSELRPLGDAMLVNAIDAGKVNWSPVRDLAKGFVTDVGRCVLADAVSRALRPPSNDPNAPKISPLEVDQDALRAGFKQLSADLYGGITFKTDSGSL